MVFSIDDHVYQLQEYQKQHKLALEVIEEEKRLREESNMMDYDTLIANVFAEADGTLLQEETVCKLSACIYLNELLSLIFRQFLH
jgi:hypothetical protein